PLETAAPGPSPLTLRYEQKRMNLFASTREDAQIEAVFASDTTIAALVSRPRDGVFVSTDGGSDWTFAPIDDRLSDMMFDGPLIVGRAAAHLHCSKDGGKTWRSWGGFPIEAAAAVGSAIYAAAAGVAGPLQGARVDANAVGASFACRGRDRLLRAIAAPAFRSLDEGVTWARMDSTPITLRTALERQRAAQPAMERASETPRRSDRGGGRAGGAPGGEGGRGGRRGGRRAAPSGQPPQQVQRGPRTVPPETFFTLLDPLRLLARFNSGRALTGVAGDKVLHAYAPTEQFWNSLVDAMVAESDAEGEIALSPGRRGPGTAPDGAFEILFSTDGGASWSELTPPRFDASLLERRILPY